MDGKDCNCLESAGFMKAYIISSSISLIIVPWFINVFLLSLIRSAVFFVVEVKITTNNLFMAGFLLHKEYSPYYHLYKSKFALRKLQVNNFEELNQTKAKAKAKNCLF